MASTAAPLGALAPTFPQNAGRWSAGSLFRRQLRAAPYSCEISIRRALVRRGQRKRQAPVHWSFAGWHCLSV